MNKKFVFCKIEKNIAAIEIFNKGKKNALCYELLFELQGVLQKMETENKIRAIILSGKGDSFCSGMDIELIIREDAISMREMHIRMQEIFTYLEHFRKPIIAALNGPAIGGGLLLALICDFRIACDNVLLGIPEVKRGVPVFLGFSRILQRYVGIGKIKELYFMGNPINAYQGMELGLINKVTSKKELMKESISLANEICAYSPSALEMLKRSLNASYEMSEKSLAAYELDIFTLAWGMEDKKEGFKAFLEKRKPHFKGMWY